MSDDPHSASGPGQPRIDRRTLLGDGAKLAAGAAAAPLFMAEACAESKPALEAGALHVPARVIPVPTSISPEAQQAVAGAVAQLNRMPAARPSPSAQDKEGWRKQIAATNKSLEFLFPAMLAKPAKAVRKTIGGANVCVGAPNAMRHPDRARMTIHGGAWTVLGGEYVMAEATEAAAEAGCTTFAVDYRMPPDFPFPAGLDDCVAVYREIIKQYDPKKVFISGASAGGNLTGAVALKIRDLGLPLPGAIGMMTPVTDLTHSGDTWRTNLGVDMVLRSPLENVVALYANGHDLNDPYVSPVFGDFSKGFPPTFLQSGTRDVLLSDTVRMHRALVRAGVDAELHVWEAMPHGSFGGGAKVPENEEVHTQFLKFVDRRLA